MHNIPNLVNHSKLVTRFHPEYTAHIIDLPGDAQDQSRARREERWKKERELDRGNYGVIHLLRRIPDNSGYYHEHGENIRAVTAIRKTRGINYYKELATAAFFSNPTYGAVFAKSYGWYENDSNIYLSVQYFPKADLQRYLAQPLQEAEARQIISQLLEGLDAMHQNGFAHRDMRPENILVEHSGPDWVVKLTDFGLSKRAAEVSNTAQPEIAAPTYTAPEVFRYILFPEPESNTYWSGVDMWALGIISFQILTSTMPFPDRHVLNQYASGLVDFPQKPLLKLAVSREGRKFIKSLLNAQPEQRPQARMMVRHRWISPFLASDTGSTQDYESTKDSMSRYSEPLPGMLPYSDLEVISGPVVGSSDAQSHWSTPYGHSATNVSSRHAYGISMDRFDVAPEVAPVERSSQQLYGRANEGFGQAPELAPLERSNHLTWPMVDARTQPRRYGTTSSVSSPVSNKTPDTIANLLDNADVMSKSRNLSQAEAMYREALTDCRAIMGLNHNLTLRSYAGLGEVLMTASRSLPTESTARRRNLIEAEEMLKEALGISRSLRSYEDCANTLNTIGLVLIEQRKYAEAQHAFLDGLRACRALGDSERIADCLYEVGYTLVLQQKHSEAEHPLREAVSIYKRLRDNEHQAAVLYELGNALLGQSNYQGAERVLQKALDLYKLIGNRKGSAETFNQLALALKLQDKNRGAERALQKALYNYEKLEAYDDAEQAHSTLKDIQRMPGNDRGILKGVRSLPTKDGRSTKDVRSVQTDGQSIYGGKEKSGKRWSLFSLGKRS